MPKLLVCFTLVVLLAKPDRLHGWGEQIHAAITTAALDSLPGWQQDYLKAVREVFIQRYVLIPDIAGLPENRAELGRFVVLPNGDQFTHLPYERLHNLYQMRHYFEKAIESWRSGQLDEGARYAGCLLHFLEDSGSPSHTFPMDNQLTLLEDFLETPPAFRDRPLHGLVEIGTAQISLHDYRPQLLGTGSEEALANLIERLNVEVRNARAQLIPIVEGVFHGSKSEIEAGRVRAGVVDAQVAADALYTLLSLAQNRFDPDQRKQLENRDVSSLTPLEAIHQSYFPQFAYFSDPYFGHPTRDGILENGEKKRPLVLNVMKEGRVDREAFEHGLGLGTHSRLTYALPAKVYDRFECLVGLHAELGKGGKIVYRIYLDGEAVFSSGVILGGDPAQKVGLDVYGKSEISLEIESRNDKRGGNYAVIAAPVLHKVKATPKQGLTY